MQKIKTSENRGKSIGSSEIAAVLGVCPYRTPYQLWDEKINGSTFAGNKYTKAGTILEPAVIEFFKQEAEVDILPGFVEDVRFCHPQRPYLTATPDRLYERIKDGKLIKGICEAKTTQISITSDVDLPPSWFCQAQYQAAIYNANNEDCPVDEISIAWLVRGLDFYYAHFDVDPDFGRHLLEKADEFWNAYVLTKKAPEYETVADIEKAYPTPAGSVEATAETVQAYERLVELNERIKALKEEEDVIKDNLKMIMKGAEQITYFGSVLATWKQTKPVQRLDTKKLKEEAPDVYQRFLGEPKSNRRFLLKI